MPEGGSWGPVSGRKYCARTAARSIFSLSSRLRGIYKPLKYFIGHTFLNIVDYSLNNSAAEGIVLNVSHNKPVYAGTGGRSGGAKKDLGSSPA